MIELPLILMIRLKPGTEDYEGVLALDTKGGKLVSLMPPLTISKEDIVNGAALVLAEAHKCAQADYEMFKSGVKPTQNGGIA